MILYLGTILYTIYCIYGSQPKTDFDDNESAPQRTTPWPGYMLANSPTARLFGPALQALNLPGLSQRETCDVLLF